MGICEAVVLTVPAPSSPEKVLETQSPGPTPHLLTRKLWVRAQQSVLTSSLGDSDT